MYNIKSVAKMLGMPAVTIRAWERRYQVLSPTRTESGHRLYSEQDIEDLRWLKLQTEEKGVNISQAVKLLEKVRESRYVQPDPADAMQPAYTFERLQSLLHEAMLAFDPEKANGLINLGFSMFHLEEMFHRVLAPLLQRIGEEWAQGKVSVAQEHFASNLVQQRFHQFFSAFPINPTLPKVLALCPQGELHQIGLLLFTLFLRRHSVEVVYLGADTPFEGLEQVIAGQGIRVVSISLTDSAKLAQTEEAIRRLAARFSHVRFVLGGQAFENGSEFLQPFVLDRELESWKKWFSQLAQRADGGEMTR